MQRNSEYSFIKNLVEQSRKIVVTTHFNPDGDAIGSALALAGLLRKAGREACVMVPNDYPAFLKWIPGTEHVLIYRGNEARGNELLQQAELIFCLDFSALNRIDILEEPVRHAAAKKILIDHHLEPILADFDYYFSEIQVSSTSELVYRFIEACGWTDLVDKDIASALFVGIMTDTGSYSFACNYPETFEVTATLLRAGINAEHIHRLVYDTYSENRLRLLGYCLSEKLAIWPELSTAYIALSQSELDRFKHQVGDTEGIVNYALSIENIKIAVFLTERQDRIRLSFRSKGDLSVNMIAREHFAGGGHKNAAGGDSFQSLPDTIDKLKLVLVQYKNIIDRSKS
jgi:bifunctional oligoribonuclease and PAP phosphatase NrnA